MIQPSGQTDPFDVDRTLEVREEDQGVSVRRQRDEQGRLEQAQMSRAAWMKMEFLSALARTCDSMRRVFLSHSRSARQLTGSQSVAGAHV